MKGILTSVACLISTTILLAEPALESSFELKLTLASTPSLSLDGSPSPSIVNPWKKPSGDQGFVVTKWNSTSHRTLKLFDLPGPGYWKQIQRSNETK